MTSRAADRRGGLSAPVLSACAAGVAAAFCILPSLAQAPGEMQTFESSRHHFTVSLPAGCRREEGPGTLDAICPGDADPQPGTAAHKLTALVLAVSVEAAEDTGASATELAQRYGEQAFKAELPDAVCGEAEASRVKVENVQSVLEDGRVVYSAEVTCAEVRFLRVGTRRAAVRYLIEPAARYRLIARAPTAEFDRYKDVIDTFLADFRATPGKK